MSKTQANVRNPGEQEHGFSSSLDFGEFVRILPLRQDEMSDQEEFDRFLRWLNPDRELAGKRYELIRRKLIVIFTANRKQQPEKMADDCIDIVIRKLPEIAATYQGEPEFYFLGVARMMSKKRNPDLVDIDGNDFPDSAPDPPETEKQHACLEKCLDQIGADRRNLVLEFSRYKGQSKIDHHAALARELGITVNALRIRAHRIRKDLEACVTQCLEGTG